MIVLNFDDIEYDNYYTLYYLEGFGSKVTIYFNARCVFKNDDGVGFTTLLDGYKFVENDYVNQIVRSTAINICFDGEDN